MSNSSFRRAFSLLLSVVALLAVVVTSAFANTATPGFTVGGYTLVSKVRATRTAFDMTFSATIANSCGRGALNVAATLASLKPTVAVIDNSVTFGSVAYGTTVKSSDTFTIRVDGAYSVNEADLSWKVSYAPENQPPVLDPISQINVNKGETVTITPVATDPDGDAITYSYSGWMTSNTKTTNYLDAGTHTVTVTATDAFGASNSQNVQVVVGNVNHPPVLLPIPAMMVRAGEVVTIEPKASDSDGDPLIISYSGWMTTGSITATDSDAGFHKVTVTVDDGFGGVVTGNVLITVSRVIVLETLNIPSGQAVSYTGSAPELAGLSIDIPAGALDSDRQLEIGIVEEAPSAPGLGLPVGTVYYIGPSGIVFNQPITLKIKYDPVNVEHAGVVSPEVLKVYSLSEGDRYWKPAGMKGIDTATGSVTAETTHLSYFKLDGGKIISHRLTQLQISRLDSLISKIFQLFNTSSDFVTFSKVMTCLEKIKEDVLDPDGLESGKIQQKVAKCEMPLRGKEGADYDTARGYFLTDMFTVPNGFYASPFNPAVLLHGIWLADSGIDSESTFGKTGGYLSENENGGSADVWYFDYDPTDQIEQSAGVLASAIQKVRNTTAASKVTLIAHSMGGLVSRAYLQGYAEKESWLDNPPVCYNNDVGKLLEIGTPNKGSKVADWVENIIINFGGVVGEYAGEIVGDMVTAFGGTASGGLLEVPLATIIELFDGKLGKLFGEFTANMIQNLAFPSLDQVKLASQFTTRLNNGNSPACNNPDVGKLPKDVVYKSLYANNCLGEACAGDFVVSADSASLGGILENWGNGWTSEPDQKISPINNEVYIHAVIFKPLLELINKETFKGIAEVDSETHASWKPIWRFVKADDAKKTVNAKPVFSPTINQNQSVTAGNQISFTVSATDTDGDTITYSVSNLNNYGSINSSTGDFTWTPGASLAGNTYEFSFTASDGKGGTATIVVGITVGSNGVLFSDDFSSGNFNNWYRNPASGATFSVSNGELRQSNTAPNIQYHALTYPGGYNWSDYTYSLTTRHIANFYSTTSINIYFRVQKDQYDNGNHGPIGYGLQIQPGGWGGLYKYTMTGASRIQAFTPDLGYPNYSGYNIQISAVGSSIKVTVNGVQVINVVDSTFLTGSIGLASVHVGAGFDNIVVK